jgi:hypothetical protein
MVTALLPAVLRNWRAFFCDALTSERDPPKPSVCVLIDYQNVHLTARDAFAPPGTSARDTLVDPLAFAEKLIEVRSARQRIADQKLVRLDSIRVYRGFPSNHREPALYSAAQRQRAMWERDSRVRVIARTLSGTRPSTPPIT